MKLDTVDADGLKKLKANSTGKVEVVTFYSAKCTACGDSYHALETTWRMYRLRAYDFVSVAVDAAASKDAVTAFLNKQHSSSKNFQASIDLAAVQAAFGEKWKPGSMFT